MVQVFIKPKREEAIIRFHPWIFSGAILKIEGMVTDGDIVEVYTHKGEYLATGHYHDGSIAIRIFSYEKTAAGLDFWKRRIRQAIDFRNHLGFWNSSETNCFRLIHAEGDQLPGLIIDIYGDTAVIQCHSIGMHQARQLIVEALLSEMKGVIKAVYDKSKEALPGNYSATIENGFLHGSSSPKNVFENGHSFFVDWELGQKTGFFLDQRDNRQLLAKYAKGKSVLNAFSYSGGFSVYALKAASTLVHSVDVSQKAMDWCEQNIKTNCSEGELSRHTGFTEDVLKYLKTCEQYDLLVVDPPAFAKSFAKRHNAVQGYKRLNVAAIQKLAPGGILFTFSCSQVVDRELFYNTIVAAAIEAGRQVRVMHYLSQPADHPVSLFHVEGSYLKGLVLYVE